MEHTLSIISQHEVTLEHLMYGMGFNTTGPTEQRKQLLLGCLTGNFESKLPMRADCAGILIEGVIAHGKELQPSIGYFQDGDDSNLSEEDAAATKQRSAPKGTDWDPLLALGPEITSRYVLTGDWKVFADSLTSKARNGFKVYVSPGGDRVAALRGAREAGFAGVVRSRPRTARAVKPAEQAEPSTVETKN